MQLVEPTLRRAALIWWSIAWRSAAYGLAGGIAAAIVLGVVAGLVGASDETIQTWSQFVGVFVGVPACIYAAYSRLGKVCGDFRIVLVRVDPEVPAE